MGINRGWLFSTTTLASILRHRPLSMSLFEKFRINPWIALQSGIGEACTVRGVSWETFAEALNGLEHPGRDTDWKSVPIHHLLDLLTKEHRDFLHGFIPSIGHALSRDINGDPDSMFRLRILVSEWPGFVSTLAGHIREEEEALFQRVLRYDSRLRMGWADPDFEGGSVRVFSTIRMLNQEHRDLQLMRAFLDKVQPVYPGKAETSALEAVLQPLLNGFHAKLVIHARLETDVLLPMAKDMEKRLYDQLIAGGPGFPARVALSPV